jgi:hypothetical protein
MLTLTYTRGDGTKVRFTAHSATGRKILTGIAMVHFNASTALYHAREGKGYGYGR